MLNARLLTGALKPEELLNCHRRKSWPVPTTYDQMAALGSGNTCCPDKSRLLAITVLLLVMCVGVTHGGTLGSLATMRRGCACS